jgi:hypothetical protein
VIDVALDDGGLEVLRPFVENMSVNLPRGDRRLGSGVRHNALALPTTWLIDREGATAGFHKGMVNRGRGDGRSRR